MSIDSYYKSGYTIKRVTSVDDGAGSYTEQLSDLVSTYGRMRPLSGNEILANEKLNYRTTHRFYCPVIDIKPEDKIYDSTSEKYYEVKFIKNPMEMDSHLEIDCEYLQDFNPIDFIVMDNEIRMDL